MFDWIRRLIYGELDKDKVRTWVLKKIKEEEEKEELTGNEDTT